RAGREFSGKCPSCGYASGFTITDRKRGLLLVYCHAGGCSQRDLIEALRRLGLWSQKHDRKVAIRKTPMSDVLAEIHGSPNPNDQQPELHAGAIWVRSHVPAGTLTETYLRFRGYFGPIPPSLKFAVGKHPSDGRYHPMMVAAVVLGGDIA